MSLRSERINSGDGLPIGRQMPSSIQGITESNEYSAPATTAAKTRISIPSKCKGIVIDFHLGNDGDANASTECFVAWEGGSFTDVDAAGQRKIVALGKSKTFMFLDYGTAPTWIDVKPNNAETTEGDTRVTWDLVKYD